MRLREPASPRWAQRRALEYTHGLYRVAGKRAYRGHEPGTEFVARIERGAEQRALARGDIVLLEQITPELEPGSYQLPAGWYSTEEGGST